MQSAKCNVKCRVCGVKGENVKGEVYSVECRVSSVECKV